MVYGSAGAEEVDAAVAAALDAGIDFFDTADVYDAGRSEELFGRALRASGRKVVIATKFGIRGRRSDGTLLIDGSPAYVTDAVEASRKRLGVETIDLYYLHRFDPQVPIEETVGAMARLVERGVVRLLGLSEVGVETLRRAHAVHPIAALQSEYSLWTRGVEAGILPACHELGVALVAYSPLGRGFLAGGVASSTDLGQNDLRRRLGERFTDEALAHNRTWLARLAAFAAARGATTAQLSLAWLLHRDQTVIPIPGTRRAERARENAGAAALELTPNDLTEIEGIVGDGGIVGNRYPEAMLGQLER
jgi:aryl-alcohol dehydrogenase-like predicted oxidoreductase